MDSVAVENPRTVGLMLEVLGQAVVVPLIQGGQAAQVALEDARVPYMARTALEQSEDVGDADFELDVDEFAAAAVGVVALFVDVDVKYWDGAEKDGVNEMMDSCTILG